MNFVRNSSFARSFLKISVDHRGALKVPVADDVAYARVLFMYPEDL